MLNVECRMQIEQKSHALGPSLFLRLTLCECLVGCSLDER